MSSVFSPAKRWRQIASPRIAILNIVQASAAKSVPRKWLNALYLKMTVPQRRSFHGAFAQLFRSSCAVEIDGGSWTIDFAGKILELPLTPDRMWLDWDSAISIVGHDVEIKETYAALLQSHERPEVFLDVGANYGTHSLLFLAHGVPTISFEPNAACHEYFRDCCRANNLAPRIEHVAVGAAPGIVQLSYPERHTWLGSTDPRVKQKLEATHKMLTQEVKQVTLDDYLDDLEDRRCLLKIDTEGNEYQVLRGARNILNKVKPIVIFEALMGESRGELYDLFSSYGFGITRLPWKPQNAPVYMNRLAFLSSTYTNFIALALSSR
jgi:FkbM family methyltransferase